jgi:hypothetical protein
MSMSSLALILEQTYGKVCFAVDDVEPAAERLPTQAMQTQWEQRLSSQFLSLSHDMAFPTISDQGIHPLIHAVQAAFDQHRPLLLTPDVIWITLAQGFAQHVNNHAETLRPRFVQHQGKQRLGIKVHDFPSQKEQWAVCVQEWVLQIRDQIGADPYHLLECNFSTTTPVTRTVSQVIIMDTFKQYFDYVMVGICGIPEITLLGTVEDWQSIYNRVQTLAEYDLHWWIARVLPLCQEFIATALGKPSLDFWRCIYKPKAIYGGDVISGWIADLFPYLQHHMSKAPTQRNPLLDMTCCELPNSSIEESSPIAFGGNWDGIHPNSIPLGLSEVPFKFRIEKTDKEYSLEILAGFVGVSQDSQQGTLQPELGWLVRERDESLRHWLEKIQQEHTTRPPIDWLDSRLGVELPKEFFQMLEYFDGATLYENSGHAWQIRPCQEWGKAPERQSDKILLRGLDISALELCIYRAYQFIDLEDGRCIAYTFNFRSGECWFLLGREHIESQDSQNFVEVTLQNAQIIARSLPELFEQIFIAQGKYFFN